jgi:predicted dithiol-disulfide oxidoreductase (DUF899 family)
MNKYILSSFSALLFVGIALIGCATMQSIDVSNRSRTFDADYAATLSAAVDYLKSAGWEVPIVDKQSGTITTKFRSNSAADQVFSGEERYQISCSIQKKSPTQTVVIASMVFERKTGGNIFNTEWTTANVTEGEATKKYKEILDGVQLKIVR